jgi:hypothetical protein
LPGRNFLIEIKNNSLLHCSATAMWRGLRLKSMAALAAVEPLASTSAAAVHGGDDCLWRDGRQ